MSLAREIVKQSFEQLGQALWVAAALATATVVGVLSWGGLNGIAKGRLSLDSASASFMGLIVMLAFPLIPAAGALGWLVLRGLGYYRRSICILGGALLASVFIPILGSAPWTLPLAGAISGWTLWSLTRWNASAPPTGLEASAVFVFIVLGWAMVANLVQQYRKIPDELTTVAVESRYGWIPERIYSSFDLESRRAIREGLADDPAVLSVSVNVGEGKRRQTVYRRPGISWTSYGCSGDRSPDHKDLMRCTLHRRILGIQAIRYRAKTPGSGNEVVIFFDRGELMDAVGH